MSFDSSNPIPSVRYAITYITFLMYVLFVLNECFTGTAGPATVCWLYIRGISSDVHHWHGGASHRVLALHTWDIIRRTSLARRGQASHRVLALHTWDIIRRTSLARRGQPPCVGFAHVGYHQTYITGTAGASKPPYVGSTYVGYHQTCITGTAGPATVCWLCTRGISSDVHHWHGGASHRVLALHTWHIIRRTSLARRGQPPCVGFTYVGYHQAYITGTAGRATVCWLYIRGISSDVHHWHGGASHRVLAIHTWDIIRRTSLAWRGQPPCVGYTYVGYNQTYITGTARRATVCWLYIRGISSDIHHWHGGASHRVLALHTWDIIRRTSLARRGQPPCVGFTYVGYHQAYITGTAGPATVCWLYIRGISSGVHHWHSGASHRVLALHTWDIIRRTSLARRGQPPCVGYTYVGYHHTYITGTAGRATVCWLYIRGISSDVHHWHGGASHRVLALHTWDIIRRTSLARRGQPPCVGFTYVRDHQMYITGTAGPATVCWLYIRGISSDVPHWHGGASHRVLALHTWDIIRRTSLARRGEPPCVGFTYVGYHHS